MYVRGCTHMCLGERVGVKRAFMFICMCLVTCYNVVDLFVRSEAVIGDLELIQICGCYGPDALVIRRLTHKMIRRFVPVRAVKIRRWFGFKTASFHVSVCSCIISLFLIVNIIYMLPVSFHLTVSYIWPVWLPVPFHITSMTVQLMYLVDMNIYWRHFMC